MKVAQEEVTLPMLIRTSFGSPFGRKTRIAVSVLGLDGKVKVEPATTTDAADPLRQQNPLGKIPVLILDDGSTLYDSPVILEYLDHLAGGGKIIPTDFKKRIDALKLQALADGLMDASILIVYEGRYRPAEKHEQKWLDLQQGKIDRALAALEAVPPALDTPPTVGQITVACALGYREFRFPGTLQKSCPRLVDWLKDFAARVPSFEATKPPPG
jgi:glutathione S-transferase